MPAFLQHTTYKRAMPAILVSQNAQTARKPLKITAAIIVGMAHSYSIYYNPALLAKGWPARS